MPAPAATAPRLFTESPAPGRPVKAAPPSGRGRPRLTAGNRKNGTTTVTISLFHEELLEQMLERGAVDSNSDAARRGLELLALEMLGAERVAEIRREVEGKESLTQRN